MIKAHPEIRALFGRNPYTALITLCVVALQTSIAFAMGRLGWQFWWLNLLVAYGVGAFASLTHHAVLAGLVYAAGITVCALAAWLSRASDSEDPPPGSGPTDETPPPESDRVPEFDWPAFERAFRAYSSTRGRDPVAAP